MYYCFNLQQHPKEAGSKTLAQRREKKNSRFHWSLDSSAIVLRCRFLYSDRFKMAQDGRKKKAQYEECTDGDIDGTSVKLGLLCVCASYL